MRSHFVALAWHSGKLSLEQRDVEVFTESGCLQGLLGPASETSPSYSPHQECIPCAGWAHFLRQGFL